MPTGVHARRFLQHLIDGGYLGHELMVAEPQPLYAGMCADMGWKPGPWLSIAPELRRVTTGAKRLKRFRVNGEVRMLRVYPIIPRHEPATTVVGCQHGVTLRSAA